MGPYGFALSVAIDGSGVAILSDLHHAVAHDAHTSQEARKSLLPSLLRDRFEA